jgi:hypothetical protein
VEEGINVFVARGVESRMVRCEAWEELLDAYRQTRFLFVFQDQLNIPFFLSESCLWAGYSKYLYAIGLNLRNALQVRDGGSEAYAFLQIIEQIKWDRSALPRHLAVGRNGSCQAQS